MHLFVAFLLNSLIVLVCILLHYEVLYTLDRMLPKLSHVAARYRVLLSVAVVFLTHVVEIWIFGLGYWFTFGLEGMGRLSGAVSGHGVLLDSVYLSFVTFTTVGYGDYVVEGYARYLCGIEALTGLLLVTWSASFLFIEMQKYWLRAKMKDSH
jgi:hypothetical protein